MKYFLILATCFMTSCIVTAQTSISQEQLYNNTNTTQLNITFNLAPDERLYKETLIFTVDHPDVNLSEWRADRVEQKWPGKRGTTPREGWQGPVTISMEAIRQKITPNNQPYVHISYATSKYPQLQEQLIELTFDQPEENNTPSEKNNTQSTPQRMIKKAKKKTGWQHIESYVKGMVKSTESPWIRILLVFLLGMLMSLTPCIYPMIPITIGILQSQANRSVAGNAARAVAYTLGMGTTYAILGLLASCTGPLCGYIFSNPVFVFLLAGLLMYFGLCMFGIIEMYIPRFLQTQRTSRGGSLPAAFLFGFASGTLASPCVSPGLALILSIAASLGSMVLGFAMLFAFGVGLSMPLLLVGLFSGSIHILPQAGMWMVEVKKLFGFLLFALSFYYLSAVLPHWFMLWLIGLFLTSTGIFYLYSSYNAVTPLWKKIHTVFGMALIAASVALYVKAWQATTMGEPQKLAVRDIWLTDYVAAREQALTENKLLFIDVWADFCSICITINKTLLSEPEVLDALEQQYVPLKVNGTQPASEPYSRIHAQFTITGFPTYLIVNPHDNKVVKRWSSELYAVDTMVFVQKLRKYGA